MNTGRLLAVMMASVPKNGYHSADPTVATTQHKAIEPPFGA